MKRIVMTVMALLLCAAEFAGAESSRQARKAESQERLRQGGGRRNLTMQRNKPTQRRAGGSRAVATTRRPAPRVDVAALEASLQASAEAAAAANREALAAIKRVEAAEAAAKAAENTANEKVERARADLAKEEAKRKLDSAKEAREAVNENLDELPADVKTSESFVQRHSGKIAAAIGVAAAAAALGGAYKYGEGDTVTGRISSGFGKAYEGLPRIRGRAEAEYADLAEKEARMRGIYGEEGAPQEWDKESARFWLGGIPNEPALATPIESANRGAYERAELAQANARAAQRIEEYPAATGLDLDRDSQRKIEAYSMGL